jgi:hypothetical protein
LQPPSAAIINAGAPGLAFETWDHPNPHLKIEYGHTSLRNWRCEAAALTWLILYGLLTEGVNRANHSLVVTAAVPLKSGAVFMASIVTCVAYVALPIHRRVRVEVVERLLSALRHRPVVTVMRIVAIINVAVEAVMAMEPGTGSDKNSANEPIRAVIAIGSTVIRGIVKVPVRTHRRDSNVNGNLSRCHGHAAHQRNSESRESKRLPLGHNFS